MNEFKNHENADHRLELEKIGELSRTLDYKGEVSEAARIKADEILSNRLEKGGETGKGERLNERRLCADWPRIDKVSELRTEITKVNPHYNEGTMWKINCQRCVPTMEMRRRGYDVTAKPKPEATDREDLCYKPFDVWDNPKVLESKGSGKEDIEKAMCQWGDGARAQIVVTWKGTNSGHTFMAERRDGRVVYYDPQMGNTEASGYFKRVQPGTCQFCRIDKLDVTQKIRDCCRRV